MWKNKVTIIVCQCLQHTLSCIWYKSMSEITCTYIHFYILRRMISIIWFKNWPILSVFLPLPAIILHSTTADCCHYHCQYQYQKCPALKAKIVSIAHGARCVGGHIHYRLLTMIILIYIESSLPYFQYVTMSICIQAVIKEPSLTMIQQQCLGAKYAGYCRIQLCYYETWREK